MKIFVANRNYVTWPRAMAEKFTGEGHEVIFLDNGSTYIPLLDWYKTCGLQVIRLGNNGGHALWTTDIINDLHEPFITSDPDYDLSMIPSDWDRVLLEGLREFPHVNKFGFTWEEHRVPQENPAYIEDEMYKYSEPNNPRYPKYPNGWVAAANDSSFALQRPHSPDAITGIRKDFPYTGVHMPWHITLEPSADPTKMYYLWDDEIAYYFLTCEHSSCTWGRMVKYDVMNKYLQLHNKTKEWLLNEYSVRK